MNGQSAIHRFFYCRNCSKPMLRKGKNVTMSTLMIIINRNGVTARTTPSNFVSPTCAATNNDTPTGGVIRPIDKLTIMIIPKCTGSMPMLVTIGRSIGVRMITDAIVSINVPINKSITLISNIIIIGDNAESIIKPAND